MSLSPVLEAMQTYPFVRLDEAKAALLARLLAGRSLVDMQLVVDAYTEFLEVGEDAFTMEDV